MQYYRCKCGSYEAWGSMGPPACAWCEKCQTTPAGGPGGHSTERPAHDMVAKPVETDQGGATLTRCRYCLKTAAQIAKGEGGTW